MPQSAEERYEADTSIHFIFANHSAHRTQAFQYISASIILRGKAKVFIKVSNLILFFSIGILPQNIPRKVYELWSQQQLLLRIRCRILYAYTAGQQPSIVGNMLILVTEPNINNFPWWKILGSQHIFFRINKSAKICRQLAKIVIFLPYIEILFFNGSNSVQGFSSQLTNFVTLPPRHQCGN